MASPSFVLVLRHEPQEYDDKSVFAGKMYTQHAQFFSKASNAKAHDALGVILINDIACLPAIVARQELAAGTLAVLPWKGPELAMKTLVVWHSDKWLSPAMESFLSLLRASLR